MTNSVTVTAMTTANEIAAIHQLKSFITTPRRRPMKNLVSIFTICFALLTNQSLADDEVPGAPQSSPIILTGGTIHPVSGDVIEKGEILFENGLITAIGKKVDRPKKFDEIKIEGQHVYPGLFESHSNIGLTEISAVRATNDFSESGSLNPNVKALVSIYPDNMIIPVTRANGVLFAVSAPSGGMISGKSAVIQLDGWTFEDMAIRNQAAMQMVWPSQTIPSRWRARLSKEDIEKRKKERAERLTRLREFFDQAKKYHEARDADDPAQKYDARLEAMGDVIKGKLPLMVEADSAADIQSTVAFAEEQGVKAIILGGYDAEQCADLLNKHEIPVIISATHRLPRRRGDAYDASYTLPERLRKAKVKFAISCTARSETWNTKTLPYHAAMASAFGLSEDEAIKAITLYPAQILGVDDKIGSLDVGKHASLIVTSGSPLETTTTTEMAFLQGRKVDLSDRHLRLYKKYEQKYRQQEMQK
jgi:imidazolonepropionase-like amidohydrolase